MLTTCSAPAVAGHGGRPAVAARPRARRRAAGARARRRPPSARPAALARGAAARARRHARRAGRGGGPAQRPRAQPAGRVRAGGRPVRAAAAALLSALFTPALPEQRIHQAPIHHAVAPSYVPDAWPEPKQGRRRAPQGDRAIGVFRLGGRSRLERDPLRRRVPGDAAGAAAAAAGARCGRGRRGGRARGRAGRERAARRARAHLHGARRRSRAGAGRRGRRRAHAAPAGRRGAARLVCALGSVCLALWRVLPPAPPAGTLALEDCASICARAPAVHWRYRQQACCFAEAGDASAGRAVAFLTFWRLVVRFCVAA